jgi:hypothetical protein
MVDLKSLSELELRILDMIRYGADTFVRFNLPPFVPENGKQQYALVQGWGDDTPECIAERKRIKKYVPLKTYKSAQNKGGFLMWGGFTEETVHAFMHLRELKYIRFFNSNGTFLCYLFDNCVMYDENWLPYEIELSSEVSKAIKELEIGRQRTWEEWYKLFKEKVS